MEVIEISSGDEDLRRISPIKSPSKPREPCKKSVKVYPTPVVDVSEEESDKTSRRQLGRKKAKPKPLQTATHVNVVQAPSTAVEQLKKTCDSLQMELDLSIMRERELRDKIKKDEVRKSASQLQPRDSESAKRILDLEQRLEAMSAALRRSEDKLETSNQAHLQDLSGMIETLSCEICTNVLWAPFVLPKCGHIFCEPCLANWFQTTQPHFTCPLCRKPNRHRPIELFFVKRLVKNIVQAQARAGAEVESEPERSQIAKAALEVFFPRTKPVVQVTRTAPTAPSTRTSIRRRF